MEAIPYSFAALCSWCRLQCERVQPSAWCPSPGLYRVHQEQCPNGLVLMLLKAISMTDCSWLLLLVTARFNYFTVPLNDVDIDYIVGAWNSMVWLIAPALPDGGLPGLVPQRAHYQTVGTWSPHECPPGI